MATVTLRKIEMYCNYLQWTCNCVAFEMVALKMGTRSATTRNQLVCSKQLCEWPSQSGISLGQEGNHAQFVCDNTEINCEKSVKVSNLLPLKYLFSFWMVVPSRMRICWGFGGVCIISGLSKLSNAGCEIWGKKLRGMFWGFVQWKIIQEPPIYSEPCQSIYYLLYLSM